MYQTSLRFLAYSSKALAGNPMGNPTERVVPVLLPYNYSPNESYPVFWFLDGYFGNGCSMLAEPGAVGSPLGAQLHAYQKQGIMPRSLCVFPDCSTVLGGSQYINSEACGPFLTHLVDELVPFIDSVFPTVPEANARVLTGHSSGGYGALVVPMLRPGVFGHAIASAADSAFELSMQMHFPVTAFTLKKAGGIEPFLSQFFAQPRPDRCSKNDFLTIMTLAMASCYSPKSKGKRQALAGTDAETAVSGQSKLESLFELPFDIDSLQINDTVWERWLAWDPVRMLTTHGQHLKELAYLQLDVGTEDEYCAQFGHRAMHALLKKAQVGHMYSEFPGGHSGTSLRYRERFASLAPVLKQCGIETFL